MTVMTMRRGLFLATLASLGLSAMTAVSQTAAPAKPAAPVHAKRPESEGQRIFAENCSRCHNAPDGFSTHVTGTILMHMRVRANLSKHQEQELLRFFNP